MRTILETISNDPMHAVTCSGLAGEQVNLEVRTVNNHAMTHKIIAVTDSRISLQKRDGGYPVAHVPTQNMMILDYRPSAERDAGTTASGELSVKSTTTGFE